MIHSWLLCLVLCLPPTGTGVRVRTTDLDANGHVNTSRYHDYLQWARWDWLESKGFTRDRLVAMGCVPNTGRTEIDHRKAARLDDRLVVTCSPIKVGEKSYTFKQTIMRGDELVVEAIVIMVNFDPAIGKAKPIPCELRKALEPGK